MMKEHNSVYLAWQSSDSREWHVVGLLKQHQDKYTFNYTQGALQANRFIPFSGMNDYNETYTSSELFPVFKNRLLSRKRPEYKKFIQWLGLDNDNSINILGRSGGRRNTDQLQLFKRIEIQADGSFEHVFFSHGISHLPENSVERISKLAVGEQLYICFDCQNVVDHNAVLIRADNPIELLGYCPRYLAKDIKNLIEHADIKVFVESLNHSAPTSYKLRCKLTGKLDKSTAIKLMDTDEFQLIS